MRREIPGDVEAIRAVTAAAFARPGEDIPGEAPLVDWLRATLLGSTRYYPRFGFRPASEYGITPWHPEWGEHFQARALTAYDPAVRGEFAYPEPFDRL